MLVLAVDRVDLLLQLFLIDPIADVMANLSSATGGDFADSVAFYGRLEKGPSGAGLGRRSIRTRRAASKTRFKATGSLLSECWMTLAIFGYEI